MELSLGDAQDTLDISSQAKKPIKTNKLSEIINYCNLLFDICFTVMVSVLSGVTPASIVFGIILVLIRMSVKIMQIIFNYRAKSGAYGDITYLPSRYSNLVLSVCLFICCGISVSTYFINKKAMFKALIHKIGASFGLDIVLYVVSVWAMIAVLISLYPAFYHQIKKMREKEGIICLTEKVFSRDDLETPGNHSKFIKVEPSKEVITQDQFNEFKNVLAGEAYPGRLIYKDSKMVQELRIQSDGTYLMFYYNVSLEETGNRYKVTDLDKVKDLSLFWTMRGLFRSKKIKTRVAAINYLMDMPFMYFAIKNEV